MAKSRGRLTGPERQRERRLDATNGASGRIQTMLTAMAPNPDARLILPPLVFGAMARRQASDAEREQLLRGAIDRGLTAIDTAPLYDFGRCEEQIGRVLQGVPRDHVQILTKVGLRWDGDPHGRVLFSFNRTTAPEAEGGAGPRVLNPHVPTKVDVRKDLRPEAVRADVEASLRRMRLDYLDLVQIHHPDIDTPIADTLGTLLDLRTQGLLREIGVSNFSAAQLREARQAMGDVPLFSVQNEYSLLRRHAESDVLPLCRETHIALLAYSPLAAGALCARIPQIANRAAMRRLRTARQTLEQMALTHGVQPSAVALAWLIAQPGVTPVAGASTTAQLDANLAALQVALTRDEVVELGKAFCSVNWPESWEQQDSVLRRAMRRGRRAAGRVARTIRNL